MSWSEARRGAQPEAHPGLPAELPAGPSDHGRRHALRALCLLALAVPALGGCGSSGGFRPLYGPTASGTPLDERMAEVDIAPIPGRVGQRVRNELIFLTTGGGEKHVPKYSLEIAVKESIQGVLVKVDGDSTGMVYAIDANLKLIQIADRKILYEGSSHARAPFERYQSIYSNVRARTDAENRAAKNIAVEIRTRLAAILSAKT